jgi:DNA ligase (NAD+)
VIHALRKRGVHWPAVVKSASGKQPLKGKIFVLTGTLSGLTRDQAKKRLQVLGGKVAGSVSKKTDYVVVGGDPGSKAEKARQLDIPLLDESTFLKLIEGE